jgi:hypothetical protein
MSIKNIKFMELDKVCLDNWDIINRLRILKGNKC